MKSNFGFKIAIGIIVLISLFGLGGTLLSSSDYLFGNGANSLNPDPYVFHLYKAQESKSCNEPSCKDDALQHYKMALEVNPEGRSALDGILSELIKQRNFDEALLYYQKLTEIYPERNIVEILHATPMFLGLKQYENALSSSDAYLETMQEKKLEFASEYALALKNKAKALINLERYDEAISIIDESYELNPSGNTLVYKGVALSNQGKYQEALKVFEISKKNYITEEDDEKGVSLLSLERAIVLWYVGNYEESEEIWDNIESKNIEDSNDIIGDEIYDAKKELQNLVNHSP